MIGIDVEARQGDLDLRVSLPEHDGTTVVVGPNGAGKSTLLKSILGVCRPRHGTISVNHEALFCTREGIDVPTEERRLGYVPQSYALFSNMTVFENVAFGVRGLPREERRDRVMELLEDLGVAHLAERKTPGLSGGESQRVALARALAIGPQVLLLDEPTAALDAQSRRKVRRFLAVRLRAIGIPSIVVTHDVDDVVALGGRIVVLEAGRVTQTGSLDELRSKPATEFVRELLSPEPEPGIKTVNELRTWV